VKTHMAHFRTLAKGLSCVKYIALGRRKANKELK
jgi:hypothetical protein